MLRIIIISCLIAQIAGRAAFAHDTSGFPVNHVIIPGERFGFVTRETSEKNLSELLGSSQVQPRSISLGEGFVTWGTIVFPDTDAELEIAWADEARETVAFVSSRREGSPWHTPAGVSVGTNLIKLQDIAGGPVSFLGFGWDYGGSMRWEAEGNRVSLILSPKNQSALTLPYLGDKLISPSRKEAEKLDVRVVEISLSWGARPFHEYECVEEECLPPIMK